MNTITLPSTLEGFRHICTETASTVTDRSIYLLDGILEHDENPVCPECGRKMHSHDVYPTKFSHIPFAETLSIVRFNKHRYSCPGCGYRRMEDVPFQADRHRITKHLHAFCNDLLSCGLTIKMTSHLTGLGKNVVKQIDKERLEACTVMES